MRKIIAISFMILSLPAITVACDICGCGVGNNYIGILPDFHKKIMGLRYRYNSLLTHIGAGGSITYLTTDETYRTIELWGGINLGRKFRIIASIPVNFNEKQNQGNVNRKTGLGDIAATGYYELLDSRKSLLPGKLFVQSLWAGGGFKLPTGEHNPVDKPNTNDNSNLFQLGTGSIDFTANILYDARLQDAGINVAAAYKINTGNKYDYRYGNKFNLSTIAYYKIRIKDKLTISPNAGVLYETAAQDRDGNYEAAISGGRILLGSAGLEAAFKNILVGGNWQTPVSQQLANGSVRANNRAMLHLSLLF